MSDYNYEPKEKPSAYLRLKSRGDSAVIRLASVPYRKPTVWKEGNTKPLEGDTMLELSQEQWMAIYRDPEFNVAESFLWEVIDRGDGLAKIYAATPGIYKTVKEYAEMSEWGDPQGYDLKVERTEEPGRNYYKVTALPNKDALTQRDLGRLEELKFAEKEPAARKLSERQVDYMENVEQDFDGGTEVQADIAAKAVSKADGEREVGTLQPPEVPDVVIEDIPNEPINLNDIPF